MISCWDLYGYTKPKRVYALPPGQQHTLDYIIDNIYLGDWDDSIAFDKLKHNNVKGVLTLNYYNKHTPHERNQYEACGIAYKYVTINDAVTENITPHINGCLSFIKECDGNVLVHCTAGISRSASIVIAYLIKEHNMSYQQALAYVKSRRPIVKPNDAFEDQLIAVSTSLQ
jgi:atypical dual specificity phosphatase